MQRTLGIFVLGVALGVAGLVSAPVAEAGPADGTRAHDVSGVWQTSWGGEVAVLTLQQSGPAVSGSYTTTGAPPGSVQGTLSGNELEGTWVDQQGSRGRFRFLYSIDFRSFVGTWGSGESNSNGGTWNGTR